MQDRFKYIKGFEKYSACTDGHIYSNDYNHTGKMQILKEQLDKDGYPYVRLIKLRKQYKKMVHRLTAETFIEKERENLQVNHKNGIKIDNRVDNLEWCSCKENILHCYRVLGKKPTEKMVKDFTKRSRGTNNPKSKINYDIANNIREDRANGSLLKDLADKYKLSISQVGQICKGNFWQHSRKPRTIGEKRCVILL